MVREREEDLISRLIDILDSKQKNYQIKLKELEQKRKIENILLKNPGNPFKSIVELPSTEIIELASSFLDIKYDINEIDINRYWYNEASNKETLKKSIRYKDSKKFFEKIIDKLQQYLDYIRDFNISEEENNEYLDIVTNITKNLRKDYPIFDLSKLFPILISNETLSYNDIYNFLISIAVNNVRVINPDIKSKNITVTFSRDVKTYLNSLLEEKIAIKEEERSKINKNNPKLSKLQKIVTKIEKDYMAIIDIYPNSLYDVLKDFWSEDIINNELEKLEIPITVLKGKKQGLELDIAEEELAIITGFKDKLMEENNAKHQVFETMLKDKREIIDNDIAILNLLITKLKMSSKSLLNTDDFYMIISLLQDNNQSYEYIVSVINMLNSLNLRKCCREFNNVVDTTDKKSVSKEVITTDNVSIEDAKRIEGLLKKHGFRPDQFPTKLMEELLKNTTYIHVKDMVEFIDKTPELKFLKAYTSDLGSEPINKKIHDIKCSQICFILAYSSVEILNNLIDISKADDIALTDIFAIPKVFASKNNEKLSGTYENFIINEKFIKNDYPSILGDLMNRCPVVLGTDSYLFRKNVELTEAYGMSIVHDSKDSLPSPLALAATDFENIIDRYIEAQDYDYIECFRSQLETNASVVLRIKYLQLKGIDFKQGGFVDTNSSFNSDIEKYLDDLTIENIPVALNDPLVKWLDSINEEINENKRKIQYIFNGVYISKIKLLKYYSTLIINGYKDKKEALLYSMVKDSYLTSDEFDMLKSLVYEKEDN